MSLRAFSGKRFLDAGKTLVGIGEQHAVDHIVRLMTNPPVYLRQEIGFQAYSH